MLTTVRIPRGVFTVLAVCLGVGLMFYCGDVLAQATPGKAPSLKDMTDEIKFGEVITAIMAVGASIVGLYLAWRGVKFVLSALRGA